MTSAEKGTGGETPTGTQRVEIVVSLDQVVDRDYDEDGSVMYEVTVLDKVIERAAADLVRSERRDVHELAREAVKDSARAAADAAIAQALSEPFRPTNRYGEATQGEPMTLRAMIADEAHRWMTGDVDRFNNHRDQPVFKSLLQKQVDEALRAELVSTVRNARDIAVARVKDQASDLIATAVKEAMAK